jgi:hypothetical protein
MISFPHIYGFNFKCLENDYNQISFFPFKENNMEENLNPIGLNEIDEKSSEDEYYERLYIHKNNIISKEKQNNEIRETDITEQKFLNKKRSMEKSELYELFENCNYKEEENINVKIKGDNHKKGRYKKGEDNNGAKHNKFKKDNIMRKIKASLFNYHLKLLNEKLKNQNQKFKILPAKLKENVNKNINLMLLDKKLCDIYKKPPLDDNRFANDKGNSKLINKIYKDNNLPEVIELLNMSFKEFLEHIRKNDRDNYLATIREKEKKNQNTKDLDNYIKEVEDLLDHYEEWFEQKREKK